MEARSVASMINLILKAVALAMGAAVIVLPFLGATDPSGLLPMLGIGLFALSLWALRIGGR